MKNIKEINLTPDIGRGTSPHVKPKQPYYSGYSGGMTDSAASATSTLNNVRRVDLDLYDEEEEEIDLMPENILNNRVKNKHGYSLSETLRVNSSNFNLNESVSDIISDGIYSLITGVLDTGTAEKGGYFMLAASLPTNLYQLYGTNKKADAAIKNKDIVAMKSAKEDLIRDIGDILSAIALAFPGLIIDDIASAVILQLKAPIVNNAAKVFNSFYSRLPSLLQTMLDFVALPSGGPIITNALSNIDEINQVLDVNADSAIRDDSDLSVADIMSQKFNKSSSSPQVSTDASSSQGIQTPDAGLPKFITDIIDQELNRSMPVNERKHINLVDLLEADVNSYYGIDEDLEEDEAEEEIDEMGYTLPLGATNKAPKNARDHIRMAEEVRRIQDWKLRTAGRIK